MTKTEVPNNNPEKESKLEPSAKKEKVQENILKSTKQNKQVITTNKKVNKTFIC